MDNIEVKLAGPTVTPNTYAGRFASKYIAAALLSGDTLAKGLISILPNVAHKAVVRNWQDSIAVDPATCDFTDTSSVTLGEYVMEVFEKQVNLQLCKDEFVDTWESVQAGVSGWKVIPKDFNSFLIAQVAAEVAQACEQGIWRTNLFYLGTTVAAISGLGGYLLDNSAIIAGGAASVTATTPANVVDRLQSMLDDMPDELYGKDGLKYYVSTSVMKAYQAALSAGNYNFQGYVGEKPMDFQGIPMELVPGLTTTNTGTTDEIQAVLGMKTDLHFGTGLMNDKNKVKVLDMEDNDGSQNFRVIMRFTGGLLATNPTQQTILRVTIP